LPIGGAPEGFDGMVLATIAHGSQGVLHVARDDSRMAAMAEALAFFAPDLEVMSLPAWDCLPYDRVSPNQAIAGARMEALCRLAALEDEEAAGPRVVLTTVNAVLQRVPPRDEVKGAVFRAEVGGALDLEALAEFLAGNGYQRADTVIEPGEYAIRGGIVDVFAPGAVEPMRLDLFGDALEAIRLFDPFSQRTTGGATRLDLTPVSEVTLDEAAIQRFRTGYRALFGAVTDGDPLYAAVTEGRKQIGMEHWLPLFHERLETVFDYLPEAVVTLDHLAREAATNRFEAIRDH
jgi:transcription-repair coupling factor (superfamily II helicase)